MELTRAIDVEMTLAHFLAKLHNAGLEDGRVDAPAKLWTPQKTPLNGKTCRTLGRSPTEAECPPMKILKVDTADAN